MILDSYDAVRVQCVGAALSRCCRKWCLLGHSVADYGSRLHDRTQGSGSGVRTCSLVDTTWFLRAGTGIHRCIQGAEPTGLFLVLPDSVVGDREEARDFLEDAFQTPMDAIKALSDTRTRAPATRPNSRGREGSEVCHFIGLR